MQNTDYGLDPEEVLVFDFGDEALQDIEDASRIAEQLGFRHLSQARHHMEDAAYNARMEDKLLGLDKNKVEDIHSILSEISSIEIEGHRFTNSRYDRLAGDFLRQMERAETAAEVGEDRVATEEY